MLKSMVREALLASVTCTRAAGQLPDQPGVDGAEGELAGLGALSGRPGTLSSIQRELVPEKYASITRPVLRRISSSAPVALQPVAERGGAAVLPHDGVDGPARPVARSQTTVVSRWLVMPMAAMSRGRDVRRGQRLGDDGELGRPDLLRIVLHPAGLREDLRGTPSGPTARMLPSWSKRMARELVVPWSRARMKDIPASWMVESTPQMIPKRLGAELLAEFSWNAGFDLVREWRGGDGGALRQRSTRRGGEGRLTNIVLGWGLGVTLGFYVAGKITGAHLNPAVSLALAMFRGFPWRKVIPTSLAQTAGAFCAAALVFWNYRPAFREGRSGW